MTPSMLHNPTPSRRLLAAACSFFCLAVFALSGCSPDAAITSPDEPAADAAPIFEALASNLDELTADFEADLAAGLFTPALSPPGAMQIQAVNYSFTNMITDNILASGYGSNCPAANFQVDQARLIDVLLLDQPTIDDMNVALGTAGGSVTIEHAMRLSFSVVGNGAAIYRGRVIAAVKHAAGGRTPLDLIPESQSAPPDGTFTNNYAVTLTSADVSLMAPGDIIVVAALGIGRAAAQGCTVNDQAILQWRRPSGGDPLLRILP